MQASACGVTSKVSSRQTPARGQAVTLRTVLPHASRVVMPTAASRRIKLGVSSRWTKWSWMSWRVVTWQTPSLYSSARSARVSIWSGVSRPIGILIRCIPGASQIVSGPLVRPSDGYGSALGPVPSLRWPLS